jgi:hypothetical protein
MIKQSRTRSGAARRAGLGTLEGRVSFHPPVSTPCKEVMGEDVVMTGALEVRERYMLEKAAKIPSISAKGFGAWSRAAFR